MHWFNTERPHEALDDLTPHQVEQLHYTHRTGHTKAADLPRSFRIAAPLEYVRNRWEGCLDVEGSAVVFS